ncbi:tRNA (adenosine(37)-N6)-threonylcarbamoyltransferase complex transferase subunit TsaD [Candidatus Nomurabacteria bacterium RIFCSPHIGHO2_02_FULL_41_18]|uniref:tRNA N6-adenosine threonylcarbamoyltransferase n=1 Tax=Candidatus Nomurabacteria bacterium RIFCSPHIGHO2_02_FULL_41_18 TaxID=1801754 RepID=A0A1F6W6G4_9BACT|nr:MAG: tRNA (adenosine(37)-N6)-threonylcarbamoyltransferase complex transferase subunit TsaD [Candidatus Nomurabacteria bacterium RIFCSPHIGHO2_01_FULL_41_71]OGI77517.1 MAG: tRNA (adenosine(37)-N6)-threonylcarbamoyltransferase complex transferase subunit TsaD [Candidatus Nomurabacteria bacterium RIFCSPHIGHO2_02_FULL_41_18]OGI89534.1 MAG: tRNA (adenosine(37)-N6)-threonylcarbamoyltransferase complex transferase subunit TsaD [Candidatus Nomurabacteria bacterium RIFCSPLOWO2_01_FULL_41_52b]OGJ00367.1
MKILSIETSCDDTCISIIEATGGIKNAEFKILANCSNSQIKTHIPYGGVYPALAKREHIKNLPILLEKSLKETKLSKKHKPVNLIAVTYGPGLEMCLWEGILFAKKLAKKWGVPVIPVNHMEGHVLSIFGKSKGKFKIPDIKFPILSLLVSGGHTQLVLIKKWMNYKIIGETLDDAVGEAFDKVARMLELPYPGGPHISALAEKLRIKNYELKIKLPRPMLKSPNFNFSFAGLKTAVFYLIKKIGKLDEKTKAQIALEFENAAVECLVYKTGKAMEKYKIKTLIVAGGVAGNAHLQREIKKITKNKVKLFFPPKGLSGDNSIMIGIAGYLNYIKNKKKTPNLSSIKATGNLKL